MAAQAGPDSWTGPVSFPEGACTQLATDRGRGRMKPLVTALVRRAQRDGQQATRQPAGVRAALTGLFVPMFPAGRRAPRRRQPHRR
jgi:hypothetical protein